MRLTRVAAAVIRNESGNILICRRGAGGSCAFLWEFPGGKLEPGETPAQCAARECEEELNVGIAVGPLFWETRYSYPEREVALSFFHASIVRGVPEKRVHLELKWVAPPELCQYEFCPADGPMVRKLAEGETEWTIS